MNNFEAYEIFIDENGTIYQKIEDDVYDYKLNDDLGCDYCTIKQMKNWKVIVKKILKIEEV